MLFGHGLRSILAVTFLTGLAPLSAFGAPLSQVEDGIERRALPPGHHIVINGQHHVLGPAIGDHPGSTATVHHVVGQPGIVAKVFNPTGVAPIDQHREAQNLHQVGEFHGSGNVDGHHVILATKHTGNTLENTHVYRHANAAGRQNLKAQAANLAMGRNAIHAQYHGIVHTDANKNNILYHEHQGMLTSAHFVDWGLARPAAMGPNRQLDSRTQAIIHRTGSKAIHGITR